MGTHSSELFIFRTDLSDESDFSRLKTGLEKVHGVHFCTIDLQDRDRVLRVGCVNVSVEKVVEEVAKLGFLCQELED